MDDKQILQQLDRIKEVPTLPSIVFELNKYLQDPETSVSQVSELIEKDQSMALKILKLVNSASYGFKSKVSDIRSAIVLLGFNAVRNAIVSLSVIDSISKSLTLMDFDIAQFWRHSLAVAVTSKSIAQQSKTGSPDDCFVGGLLHDVGKVILAQYFKDMFVQVWSTLQDEYLTFYQAEQKVLPIDHTKIGAHLAGKWQLPRGLVDAIRWHHEVPPETDNFDFVKIVYLANLIVNSYDVDPDCKIDTATMNPDVLNFMLSMVEDIGGWYASIADEIEGAYDFFLER
jgi:putative nucleotidyltransferase with HDIG domain